MFPMRPATLRDGRIENGNGVCRRAGDIKQYR
jgi:hypothetical protein